LVLSFDLNDTALLDKLWPIIAAPEVLAINSATAGGACDTQPFICI